MTQDETSSHDSALKIAVEAVRLPNGLQILLVERPQLPILAFVAMVRSGVVRESPEEAGLAQFTAALLTQGTRNRTATGIAEEIDALGANLGVHSDYDYSTVGLSCLSDDREAAVDILSDVLTGPVFDPDEIERKRNDILSLIRRVQDDLVYRVRVRLQEGIFGDHPYRRPRLGYEDTIRQITPPAIRGFYERFYRPENTVLSVVGCFDGKQMVALLQEKLGGWPTGKVIDRGLPSPPDATGIVVDRMQKQQVAQATLHLGAIGIERAHPDYVSLALLNYILGGAGFGSRLMTALREERGLTYGVYSSFLTRKERGYFFVGCQTGLDTMNEALAGMFREVERLRDHGVTQEELDWAKKFLTGSLPLTLETNDQLANHVLEQELYGLEDEFWIREIEEVRRATLDQVNTAARLHLTPDRFRVVALADFSEHPLVVPGESVDH